MAWGLALANEIHYLRRVRNILQRVPFTKSREMKLHWILIQFSPPVAGDHLDPFDELRFGEYVAL